jgi:CRISPR-associated protein Csb2
MSLVLEIEHLTGLVFAAGGPERPAADWPPQPDRVFSALVASWAARGERAEETAALEWLERQDTPVIAASSAMIRSVPVSFVPPNDRESGKTGDLTVLPTYRRRQPRRFPTARPDDPLVRLIWSDAEPDETVFAALSSLAADTSYVGHSASLTRCWFQRSMVPAHDPQPAKRRLYPGRLAELRAAFTAGRRPGPGESVTASPKQPARPPGTTFSQRWLLLEHMAGEMPDIRAGALVAKAIRDTVLAGYQRIGLGEAIPERISGHDGDGRPTSQAHLAVVPLAFVGYPHADGRILGFALVPPGDGDLLDDPDFRSALRKVMPTAGADDYRMMTVAVGADFEIGLRPTIEAERASLDPTPYIEPATTFATVTPIVLDRHLKKTGAGRQEEIVAGIVSACRNIGLPEPAAVIPLKHSAVEGAPSAWPSGSAPSWTRWRLPSSLASRTLTHAIIRFADKVGGPVMLGAGRFVGLGLCRRVGEE